MSVRFCKRYKCLPNLLTCHMGDPTCAGISYLASLHPHTLFFKAERGNALTTFLAGFAFTITTFPKTSLFPALVAGFTRVLILQRPGIVNTPVLFTSCVAISARLFRICPHTLFFVSVLVDSASAPM